MDINDYQDWTEKTAIYPKESALFYEALGLASECGEVAGAVKKIIRDDYGVVTDERREQLIDELGDVEWYLSRLATSLGIPRSAILDRSVAKLEDRLERGKIKGSGDKR